ncbi:MAG TPA: cytochrome c [Vicinamibacteria bacterium]|nr:cytochrome c [Vicinamibacteria bacterium]
MKFLLAILVVLLLAGGVAAFVVKTGRLPIAATTPPDFVDRVAVTAKFKAVVRGAAGLQVTVPTDAASVSKGREHYVENCLPCHGAPGVKPAEFAEGMNPKPPDIDGQLQNYNDAQLFWVIKNGIRATGMPGFGVNHKDEEIAAIAAFVRHTPRLTQEERKDLAAAASHEDHHHEGEGQTAPEEHGAEPHHHH